MSMFADEELDVGRLASEIAREERRLLAREIAAKSRKDQGLPPVSDKPW